MNKVNTISGAILFAVAAGYGYMVFTLPTRHLKDTMGAAFMPTIFDIALAVLSIALIAQGIRGRAKVPSGGPPQPLSVMDVLGILLVFAIFFAYIMLINVVGFLIVTPVVLLALLLLQGIRKPLPIIAFCLGATAGVYLLFRYGFAVQITGVAFVLP